MLNRLSKSAGTDCSSRYQSTQVANAAHNHGIDALAIKCRESRRSLSDAREHPDYPTATGTPSLWPVDSTTLFSLSEFTDRLDRIIRKATDVTGM